MKHTKYHFVKILQYAIGAAIIIEGADKFFNILVDWKIYAAREMEGGGIQRMTTGHSYLKSCLEVISDKAKYW